MQPLRGFTLTEMLVATALTLIILLMFAQIFRSATATVTQQRGIGQNDARARMMNTVIRSDLQKMTFRDHPQSTSRGLLTLGVHDDPTVDPSYRPIHRTQSGFFYVSENDPDNDVDDVLHFTVALTQTERNDEDHTYVGKAAQLGRPDGSPFNGLDVNQPESDDGDDNNGASQSRYAEVMYFIRNGTLYRRIMLIRDPVSTAYGQDYPGDPTFYEVGMPDIPRSPLIPGDYDNNADSDVNSTPSTRDFWHDFDFSAYHDNVQVKFHDRTASLSNLVNTGSLGDPKHRFGFQYRIDTDPNRDRSGRPVEYVDNGTTFIGRLTHEETSDPAFTWPAQFAGSPFSETDLTVLGGVVRNPPMAAAYSGPRIGEDILLPNVDAFDVQLWETDSTDITGFTGRFVNIGHTGTGHFSDGRRRNDDFGPRTPSATVDNNIFDTWHWDNTEYGWAPYRALTEDPVFDPVPAGRTLWDWEPATTYTIRNGTTPGSRVFPFAEVGFGPDERPGAANTDDDGDTLIDEPDERGWPMTDDVAVQNDGIYYEAVDHATGLTADTSGPTAADRPSFRKRYTDKVYDGNIVWQCFDNRVGVPLIQIIIRYRDPQSNLSRQLTIRHSLTDRAE